MPNNRSNRNRRNKRKQQNRRPNGRNGPRMWTSGMQGAPVGVSQDLQQFTRFMPSDDRRSLTMHVCAPLCQFQREASAPGGPGLAFPAAQGFSAQLNLTDPAVLLSNGTKGTATYTSPVFDLIASSFVRYRVKKLVFHYEPQAAATQTERLVFAFAQDPMHPVLWNATVPGEDELLSLSDSIAFAPWRAWSMDVSSKLDNTLMYTFSDDSTSVASFAERFSDYGVIACTTSNTVAQGAPTVTGVLYQEITVELSEFCPIVTTPPSAKMTLMSKLTVDGKPSYQRPQRASSSKEIQVENDCSTLPSEVAERPSCVHEDIEVITTKSGFNYSLCNDCKSILRN